MLSSNAIPREGPPPPPVGPLFSAHDSETLHPVTVPCAVVWRMGHTQCNITQIWAATPSQAAAHPHQAQLLIGFMDAHLQMQGC